MARKKPDLPKWTGTLTKPCKPETILDFSSAEAKARTGKQYIDELRRLRFGKIFELGSQLGLPELQLVRDPNLSTAYVENLKLLVGFLQYVVEQLAVRIGIPGFLTPKPEKWPIEIVGPALVCCEFAKQTGKATADFPTCLEMINVMYPELANNAKRVEAKALALQLVNRVSKLRKTREREHAARTVHHIDGPTTRQ